MQIQIDMEHPWFPKKQDLDMINDGYTPVN